jgi:lipopolysaccharide/colanic/teichoic acid biosynthesis glycosyltransferase
MLDAMNFLSKKQSLCKRGMDLFLSLLFLPFLIVPILVLIIGASLDTQQFGLFFQKRVGQHGVLFTIYKIRTHQITGNISKYLKKIKKIVKKNKKGFHQKTSKQLQECSSYASLGFIDKYFTLSSCLFEVD